MKPTTNDLGIVLPVSLKEATSGSVQGSSMERGDMLMHFGMEESLVDDLGMDNIEDSATAPTVPHLI